MCFVRSQMRQSSEQIRSKIVHHVSVHAWDHGLRRKLEWSSEFILCSYYRFLDWIMLLMIISLEVQGLWLVCCLLSGDKKQCFAAREMRLIDVNRDFIDRVSRDHFLFLFRKSFVCHFFPNGDRNESLRVQVAWVHLKIHRTQHRSSRTNMINTISCSIHVENING